MTRLGSLRARLLLSAALTLLVFLGVTGLVLDRALANSVSSAAVNELRLRVLSLLSVAEVEAATLSMPRYPTDELLNDPQSGVMALVLDAQHQVLWQSESSRLFGHLPELQSFLQQTKGQNLGEWSFRRFAAANSTWFAMSYPVLWVDQERSMALNFVVLESTASREAVISSFRRTLWWGFSACGLTLLLALLLLVRWNLAPLRQLSLELDGIRSGKTQHLDRSYPQELLPLTQNLNLLLDAERKARARYRDRLGDLAHSLKTPLAMLNANIGQLPEALQASFHEQIHRMDQVVQYQLKRAVTQEQPVVTELTGLQTTVARLGSVILRAFEPMPSLSNEVAADFMVPMAEDDLMEVLGNLLENAAKYGQGQIRVQAQGLCFWVEDNGPGVPENRLADIIKRGVRMDTLTTGQGIGLAVVADILASYRAELSMADSSLGGACFKVCFAPLPS